MPDIPRLSWKIWTPAILYKEKTDDNTFYFEIELKDGENNLNLIGYEKTKSFIHRANRLFLPAKNRVENYRELYLT
jgi:hypothetical protein